MSVYGVAMVCAQSRRYYVTLYAAERIQVYVQPNEEKYILWMSTEKTRHIATGVKSL